MRAVFAGEHGVNQSWLSAPVSGGTPDGGIPTRDGMVLALGLAGRSVAAALTFPLGRRLPPLPAS